MTEKKIEVTIPETDLPPAAEDKSTEILAKSAEEESKEAGKQAEKAEEQASEAKAAAEEAKTESEKAQKSTSYNEYALKGLMDSVTLVVTRMEQAMGIIKQMAEDFKGVNEELQTTIALQQDQIATVDAASQKIVTATAALVRLHQEATQVTE
jgi:hypothetical protein